MSCGKPHEVPCTEVLARVYSYLDGEIEVNGYSQIKQHLDDYAEKPLLIRRGNQSVVTDSRD